MKRDPAYLLDMLQAAREMRELSANLTWETFQQSRLHQHAMVRLIEIIGEAASRVSRGFRAAHPEIPWQRIIAQRNVLAHEYGEIDDALVWRVATDRIPELTGQLERIVPAPPSEDR